MPEPTPLHKSGDDVERLALAMFHAWDSESALDWYEQRPRKFAQAREVLAEHGGDLGACFATLSERYPEGEWPRG